MHIVLVLLALFSFSSAESHALPAVEWIKQQRLLLQKAKTLQQAQSPTKTSTVDRDGSAVTWRRLWTELQTTQQAQYIIPASALSLGITASELLAPRLCGQLLDAVMAPGATFALMKPRLRALALLAVAAWACHIVSSILFARARWTVAMTGRVRLMDALLKQEPAFFEAQLPGELSSRLVSEPERLESLANRGPERLMASLLACSGSLALMLSMDWRLTLVAVSLRTALITKLAELAGRTVGLLGLLQQQALSEANALASEALQQPRAVAAHAARRSVLAEYAARCEEYMRVIRITLVSETALRFTRLGIDSLTNWALFACGLIAVLNGRLSVGALTAFFALADRFADGCNKLSELLNELYTIRPACARYFGLLDRQPAMEWHGGRVPQDGSCRGAIELKDVSFAFPSREASALHHVSLTIQPGETLAIVGPSGAGKSTLLRLLNRLYDPHEGSVTLDGVDVRTIDLEWLRRQFGWVDQFPATFALSVEDNVLFGPPELSGSGAAAESALEAADAAEFVRALPRGRATTIGEGGESLLSGGQRQRIAVARALAMQPAVLLWDEATSALDGQSEAKIHEALQHAKTGGGGELESGGTKPTAVVVAHRLSTALVADRVAVLREGRIEQIGTPQELAQQPGWFRENFYGGQAQQ